jgi:hypothetical protein
VLNACYKALKAKLIAASSLTSILSLSTGVYRLEAGRGAGTKYVIMAHNRGGDTNIAPSSMIDVVIAVKGVAENVDDAGSIAKAIYDALHDSTLSYDDGWLHMSCKHTSAFEYPEQVDTVTKYHSGGLYRLRASKR